MRQRRLGALKHCEFMTHDTRARHQSISCESSRNLTDEAYRQVVFDLAGDPAAGDFGMAKNAYGLPRRGRLSFDYRWGG